RSTHCTGLWIGRRHRQPCKHDTLLRFCGSSRRAYARRRPTVIETHLRAHSSARLECVKGQSMLEHQRLRADRLSPCVFATWRLCVKSCAWPVTPLNDPGSATAAGGQPRAARLVARSASDSTNESATPPFAAVHG